MEKRHFQKLVPRMKLFLSLQSFTCHTGNIRVRKYIFTSVVIKIKSIHSCRTRVVRVALISRLCRIRVTRISLVLLVLHSCCIRVTRVTLVSLVSGTRVVNQTRSAVTILTYKKYSKDDQSNFRPITLQLILLKVYTLALRNKLFVFLMKKNYIKRLLFRKVLRQEFQGH